MSSKVLWFARGISIVLQLAALHGAVLAMNCESVKSTESSAEGSCQMQPASAADPLVVTPPKSRPYTCCPSAVDDLSPLSKLVCGRALFGEEFCLGGFAGDDEYCSIDWEAANQSGEDLAARYQSTDDAEEDVITGTSSCPIEEDLSGIDFRHIIDSALADIVARCAIETMEPLAEIAEQFWVALSRGTHNSVITSSIKNIKRYGYSRQDAIKLLRQVCCHYNAWVPGHKMTILSEDLLKKR